jgi:hypothetical protein
MQAGFLPSLSLLGSWESVQGLLSHCDSKPYRTLRLTSLEHANPPVPSATTTHSNGSPTVKSVIEKVAEIEELLTSLKLDLEKLSSVSMSQQVSLPKKAP